MSPYTDPRALNCRGLTQNPQGQITGVELRVVPRPNTCYELIRVELIDEPSAQGNTVATCAVLTTEGIQIAQPVSLAWPFPDLTEFALPGNPNNQHMITNGYAPPNLGPLALCIRENNIIISDIVGGLGLPWNRHVSYRATFQERLPDSPPDNDDDPDIPDTDTMDLWQREVAAVEDIAHSLRLLIAHFGVTTP